MAVLLAAAALLGIALLASAQLTDPLPGSLPAGPRPAGPAPPGPAAAPALQPTKPSPAPTATPPAAPRPPLPGRDLRPTRIRIPALGIDRRPVPLGVLDDGSLEAPHRYNDVGWWKDGPLPGSGGNTVVVGHVDSKTGPAVFYGLASLQRGDHVAMTRRDAPAIQFRVRSVQRFPVTDLPADRVYRRDGPSGLVLITCGGEYDHAAGRYLDNVVVFADRAR